MDYVDCAICWRHFSVEVAPICLPCGHSLCAGCSGSIRRCPLCRLKLPANFVAKPNFSLIHVLDNGGPGKVLTADKQTQTEDSKPVSSNSSTARSSLNTAFFQGRSMNVLVKRGSLSFSLT